MRVLFFLLAHFSIATFALPLEGLSDLNGKAATLDHGKNKELVVFWATWCPKCKEKLRKELPEIQAKGKAEVITVNTDRSVKRASDYVRKTNLSLTVLRDPERKLRKQLKAFSVPHWAVYEKTPGGWNLVDSAPAFEIERVQKALNS